MPATMTMVRSRTAPTEDAISFPVLTHSDALPRTDLRNIDEKNKAQKNQESLAQFQFPCPQVGDQRSRRNGPPGTIATFDFRVTAPPDEVVPSHAQQDHSPMGVGIALGSPGMVNSKGNLPPPRFDTSIFTQERKEQPPARKASKWKKIGGLFRAKSALASPTHPRPSLQQSQSTDTTGGTRFKPRIEKAATEEWPCIETDTQISTTRNCTTPSRSRKFSFSNKKSSPKERNEERGQGPRLDVSIPDVQMERYSVMFSNVMNKNQRPSLLARRSKTLDNLHVPQNSDFLAAKIPLVPQRRATSPARSSFTLFPTSQPSKAAEILGTQNYSRGPKPLLRSNTLPVESPSQELPLQPPRVIPNNNSVTSFQSLPIGSSHTPRSSSLSSPFDDKPLPAIKPEPEPESSASLEKSTKDSSPKPSNIPQSQSQIPTSKSQQNPKQRSSPLKNERHVQERGQQERGAQQEKTREENVKQESVHREKRRQELMHHEKNDQSQLHHHKQKSRPSRPNLTIKTTTPTPLPRPTLKERPVRSSSIPISEESMPRIVTDAPGMTMSPSPLSSGSMSAITPQPTQRLPQPARSKSSKAGKKEATTNGETQIIQFSTARSVSVSKGKRQMLVPIGSRVNHFDSNERFVDRKALTPTITEVGYGHRPAKSQQLQIESL
ncbi:hypothetical protein N7450_001935 [Penicillium hetheringtonii]|uniref:Uncharacterized protein n=1 Tax=Penicillium hetheringtonii TaxID=911720 RepID=A0AAD6E6C2_9EURO|nr:hypothetical protein N7450_001935 [Penicillium hetheringtonii]